MTIEHLDKEFLDFQNMIVHIWGTVCPLFTPLSASNYS